MKYLGILILVLSIQTVFSQTIIFDDFYYSDNSDPALGSFNNWKIINGTNGPPSGATYRTDNVQIMADASSTFNNNITLKTTVNGQTDEITHARIESGDFDYFEGTYAARVRYDDLPYQYGDANIQTFYTIVSYLLAEDGEKYSELDFEYMASDHWGTATNNQVMYLSAWNRYIADPWLTWKRSWSKADSYEGWHTFVVSCTDGVNVKFYVDGNLIISMATSDNDGSSVYPRSPMQIAFGNWIWNSVIGSSNHYRETTMEVDWVFFEENTEILPTEIDALVKSYRIQGLKRQNLNGEQVFDTPTSTSKIERCSQKIYPNPATNVLNINCNLTGDIMIYNALGTAFKPVYITNNQLDISELEQGVYYLNSNTLTEAQIFIKQ